MENRVWQIKSFVNNLNLNTAGGLKQQTNIVLTFNCSVVKCSKCIEIFAFDVI